LAAELTQEDLTHRCGLFRTYMSRIETGNANPTLTMIHALAASLRVPVTALFEADAPKAVEAKGRSSGAVAPQKVALTAALMAELRQALIHRCAGLHTHASVPPARATAR